MMPFRRIFWVLIVLTVGVLVATRTYVGGPKSLEPEEFKTTRYVLPQPAVVDLKIMPVSEVGAEIAQEDLVLGVTIGNEARAYPLDRMNAEPRTKVVNDLLGGEPIAITWCDKCLTGAAYGRVVEGQTLTLKVFGALWRDSLVMWDQETQTQWSQWDGKARLGPLSGRALTMWPSIVVDWGAWRTAHPGGTVAMFEAKQRDPGKATYGSGEGFVLVAGDGDQRKAWPLVDLARERVVNDSIGARQIVAVFLPRSGTARLFERSIEGETLRFRWRNDRLEDETTASAWDPVTGQATAGPSQGLRLRPVASKVTAEAVWKQFARANK